MGLLKVDLDILNLTRTKTFIGRNVLPSSRIIKRGSIVPAQIKKNKQTLGLCKIKGTIWKCMLMVIGRLNIFQYSNKW